MIDGAIAGDQDPPGAGGFLTGTEIYKDYVLRLEANIDYPVERTFEGRAQWDADLVQAALRSFREVKFPKRASRLGP